MESVLALITPERLSGTMLLGLVLWAFLREFMKARREDSRQDDEGKFRADLISENRELRARADRFAAERNDALAAKALAEAEVHRLRGLLKRLQAGDTASEEGTA